MLHTESALCGSVFDGEVGKAMKTALRVALERGLWYIGDGWHYILFLLALIFLIANRNEKENRKWLAGYSILFGAVYICPLTARIIMKYCIGYLVYWRMFWLLPSSVIIAYAAAKLCVKWKKPVLQVLCMLVLTAVIVLTGKNPYVGEGAPYVKAVNLQKLPADACQVCDMINGDRGKSGPAVAVMPDDLIGYVRQYDASVELVYGRRSNLKKRRRKIHKQMNSETPDFKKLTKLVRKEGANYLVYVADEEQNAQIESYGFVQIGRVGGYVVYKDGNSA